MPSDTDLYNTNELEEQFILRLPIAQANYIRKMLMKKPKKLGRRLKITLNLDTNTGVVCIDGRISLQAHLCKLPTITETYKTYDKICMTKAADLCHILDCTGQTTILNHGLTPPLKNVRMRRFRKTIPNPDTSRVNPLVTHGLSEDEIQIVRKELSYLIQADLEAVATRFEFVPGTLETLVRSSQVGEEDLFGTRLSSSSSSSSSSLHVSDNEND